MTGIPYGLTVNGEKGSVHSIDKLIISYYIDGDLESCFHSLVDILEKFSDWRLCLDREEGTPNAYLNKRPCSAYSWFSSAIWTDGLMIRLGQFLKHPVVGWWRNSRVRVEFNPNKSFLRVDIGSVLEWLSSHSSKSGLLDECDYAVDIECPCSSIDCCSKKDRVIYNDSRYYGKRHTNGRIKIYNKSMELLQKSKIQLESLVTRCEVTCRWGEGLKFDEVSTLLSPNNHLSGLSSNLQSIVHLINLLSMYGEDKLELIRQYVPDKRNRDKVSPFLVGVPVSFVFDFSIFLRLLTDYQRLYHFSYSFVDLVSSRTFGTDVNIVNQYVYFGDVSYDTF